MSMHWIDWCIVGIVTAFVTTLAYGTKKYTRSVADFLAANRCAGKYLLGIADGIAGLGAIGIIAYFQEYYEAGFTGLWWSWMRIPVILLVTLSGWIIYRLRQTRALTMAQFFEIRYSRNFRIFAGIVAFVAGIINFGIFPAVTAKFFIYYCGLPDYVLPLPVLGWDISITSAIVMAMLIAIALLFTFMGGQITVLVTDFVQGLFCNVMFVVIFLFILTKVDWTQIAEVMANAPQGQSPVNPFDTGRIRKFNPAFYIIAAILWAYQWKAWQGSQAYNVSAKSAHEAKMAGILGTFREFGQTMFLLLLAICAYTLLHHPGLTDHAQAVKTVLAGIDNEQIQHQMTVPVSIRQLLPVGLAGALAAVMVVASISVHDTYLHSWGSIFIQDVILPFRKKPLGPEEHINWLRWSIFGVAVFIFLFGLLFRQTQHIRLFFMITGQVFIGGAGSVIIGGLYWKRGTTTGAWTAMLVGSALAVIAIVIPPVYESWPAMKSFVDGRVPRSFLDRDTPLVLDETAMLGISMACAVFSYIAASLLSGKEPFNMDRMLHRGPYHVPEPGDSPGETPAAQGWRALGMGKEFSLTDKFIYVGAFGLSIVSMAIFAIGTLMWATGYTPSTSTWIAFWKYYVMISAVASVGVTIWFMVGGIGDLQYLFAKLRSIRRDARDDGTVIDHHNLDENDLNHTASAVKHE